MYSLRQTEIVKWARRKNKEIGKKSVGGFKSLSASERADENSWAGRKDQQCTSRRRRIFLMYYLDLDLLASPKAVLFR